MKFILAFDKFKGSLTGAEASAAAKEGILEAFRKKGRKDIPEIVTLPTADGGEGTVDAFYFARGGEMHMCSVTPPHKKPGETAVEAPCLILDGEKKTAVIEMSSASGLALVGKERDPMRASSFGTGELVRFALDMGAERILLGLGGSATNDGGCGMAAALGAVFYDRDGDVIKTPAGGDLRNIAKVDISGLDTRLGKTEIVACCDVDNPLYGERGAAYVYAPQKGATKEMLPLLDKGLWNLADVLKGQNGIDIADIPGAGAAGGMGGGVIAFLGGTLSRGIDAVLDASDFSAHAASADLVFTGEGKLDDQTLCGKTVAGVIGRAASARVPVCVIGGILKNATAEDFVKMGAVRVLTLCSETVTPAESMKNAASLLCLRVEEAVLPLL